MKINPSTLKHGISEFDILYVAENWAFATEPDDDMPAKRVVLGFDRNGRLLEPAILTFDSGHELVIHAMKDRRKYRHLLD